MEGDRGISILRNLGNAAFPPVAGLTAQLLDFTFGAPGGKPIRLGDVRDDTALRFSASCLGRVDPAVLTPIVEGRWLEGYDETRSFQLVRCPTLLLEADPSAGGMLQEEDARIAQSLIRDCIRIRMDGASHLIHWSRREALLNHVTAFLESLE